MAMHVSNSNQHALHKIFMFVIREQLHDVIDYLRPIVQMCVEL